MKRCRHCGTESDENARFCTYCGRNFSEQYTGDQAAPVEPPKAVPEQQSAGSGDAPPLPTGAQSYGNYAEPQVKPPNNGLVWLILSIVMTVCCCSIFNVATIIISAISVSKYNQGDFEEARRLARIAMIVFFCLLALSIVSSIVGWTYYVNEFPGIFEEIYREWY